MRETEEETIRKAERCERGKCSYNLVLKFNKFISTKSVITSKLP